MEETSEVQKTIDRRDKPFYYYIESKELHNGSTIDVTSVNVESRLFPQIAIGKFLPNSKQNQEVEDPPDLSEEDIKYTISGLENGVFDNMKDSVELGGKLEGLENNVGRDKLLDIYKAVNLGDESVYVVRSDTGEVVRCNPGYVVKIRLKNSINGQRSIEKNFQSEEKANEFAETISEDKKETELIYDDGLKLRISSSIKDSIKTSVDMKLLLTVAGITLPLVLIIPSIVLSISLALIVGTAILSVIMSEAINYNSYDNVYEFEFDSGGTRVTVPESMDTVKQISVETEIKDECVLIKSNDIDTHWEFNIEDEVISEDAIRFFDSVGREVILNNKAIMQVSRNSTEESVESVDGRWYLSRPY